jgi:hypothetical protein
MTKGEGVASMPTSSGEGDVWPNSTQKLIGASVRFFNFCRNSFQSLELLGGHCYPRRRAMRPEQEKNRPYRVAGGSVHIVIVVEQQNTF